MSLDERATSTEVVAFMLRLADHMAAAFPHHASALRGELVGVRMTNERWNRVAAVLASLLAVPGVCLGSEEHEARGAGLAAITVAQKMAAATFGGRHDVQSALEVALYAATEISERFTERA